MNTTEIKEKLKCLESIQKHSSPDYWEQNVEMLADKIEHCRPDIRSAIEKWLASSEETDFEISGTKYADLLAKAKMTPLAAYLTLDWISRNPKTAPATLKKDYEL